MSKREITTLVVAMVIALVVVGVIAYTSGLIVGHGWRP